MRVIKVIVSILASLVLLTVLAPPAQAAVPRVPITCGMIVTHDAVLYLTKDLTCPGTGVLVLDEDNDQSSRLSVVVDLRGHTLRGPGPDVANTTAVYATYYEFGEVYLQVINGRVENWSMGVYSGWETRTRNVALVGNAVGFGCLHDCVVDRTTFARNTFAGLSVADGGGASVTRSTFVDNPTGAYSSFTGLSISGSAFIGNDLGVFAGDIQVPITRSLFIKNDTAIRVAHNNDESACADLHRVIFVKNGVNLDGPRCAA